MQVRPNTNRRLLLGITALLLVPIATGRVAADAQRTDVDAVRAVGKTWMGYYMQGNYAAIPDLYTEDAMIMPRGRRPISGREQLRKSLGGLAAGRKVDIEVTEREITIAGDIAWYIGDFRVSYSPRTPDAAPTVEFGRSMLIFRKGADGRWRIHRDMDAPAPNPGVGSPP